MARERYFVFFYALFLSYFSILLFPIHRTTTVNSDQTNTTIHPLRIFERLRWSDMDTAGILYFGQYVRLFEIAETELFRTIGFPYSPDVINSLGFYFLRLNFHTDFKLPLFLDDLVAIDMWIGKLSSRTVRLHFTVSRCESSTLTTNESTQPLHATLCGSGYCTIVAVDHITKKSTRIPDAMRQSMQNYFVPTELPA